MDGFRLSEVPTGKYPSASTGERKPPRPREGREEPTIVKDKSTTRWPSHCELNHGSEVNTQLPKITKPPASAPALTSAPASTRGDVTESSEPTTAQFDHDDTILPDLEELVGDDLEPFTLPQLITVVLLAQPLAQPLTQPSRATSPAVADAATFTTRKKRGQLKGGINKPHKKQSGKQYEESGREEQQVEMVELSKELQHTACEEEQVCIVG